ncbi:hypothetical protein GDO86_011247, partial [Hymenochirus boettgeri]
IPEAGSRVCSEVVKGVKRKKIVTENHMKKIPKSPLRNVIKDKQKHEIETDVFHNKHFSASGHLVDNPHFFQQPCKQDFKESKTEDSLPLTVLTVKSGVQMQAKKLSVPPDLCNGRKEDNGLGSKRTLPRESAASCLVLSTPKSLNIISESNDKQYSCVHSAFDVLLRAMEPELNNLNQSLPPCGTQTEKQACNIIQEKDNPNTSVSSKKSNPTYVLYQHSDQSSLLDQTKDPCHVLDHLESEHETFHSETELHKKHSFCSRSMESTKKSPVYHVAVTSSVANPSTSPLTQVLSLQANSSSSTNNSNLSINSSYSVAQVASLISGEQMCNIVLKDQKPKKQGKYICEYCSRACAKPSVLLKHIRSHTGERPYPCVTCGFSFKTKSNLYKHKKSHAHAIKLGLGITTDSGGMLLSHDSEKALCIHSDVDESGESDDESISEERQEENVPVQKSSESMKKIYVSENATQNESKINSNCSVEISQDYSSQNKDMESRVAGLPKVVVYPVNVSPLRADSPKILESASEHFIAQMPDLKTKQKDQHVFKTYSLSEVELSSYKKLEINEDKQHVNIGNAHAQLQRQQATDCSQEPKFLLSPRSLGSTDSGYFSRSESADQAMSPPTPFLKFLSTSEKDYPKNMTLAAPMSAPVGPLVQQVYVEKSTVISGTMRPPFGTKTLEERISKLISDNEAVVDDKQLDSVKPRRTSLSRRGSIDSPKSYIFKDSFQFDLKPVGRRTSSSSDIPKSPFTPNDKSKQVFFLSVPSQFTSMDCLPITRSNSMPTSGYSAVPPVIPPSHPLRGSQSFDDKIGSFSDDVFISGSFTPQQVAHPRTLVRQAAVEDSSATENCALGLARSVDENYPGNKAPPEVLLPRSKSFVQGSSLDKIKKTHHGRGTMFECETCRNRYRKLENFENHKKFYCSELHGPKNKIAVRDSEHNTTLSNSSQPQIFHYRVASSTGTLEQPLLIRKRRKMKSVGEDDEPQQSEHNTIRPNSSRNTKNVSTITILGSQSCSVSTASPQIHLVARNTEKNADTKLSSVEKNKNASAEKVELKCQGTGISVIQHTNSLSRPNSFEKIDSIDRISPVPLHDPHKSLPYFMNVVGTSHEENAACSPQISARSSIDIPRSEASDSLRSISAEKSALVTQSRLVRQCNIQVPEILVTEEPDKDTEVQANVQESQEKCSWPQRSESLSNLPTEKLPPKKKRIRLADLEHSSAESSFESTISRSLSRDSSLSRASSFSASFDKEETIKSEGFIKADVVNKSSEFLTIPTSLNTFGATREMRRSASEQINCTQPSMEVVEYRSKSFDCGSMSRSRSMSPTNSITSKFNTGISNSGHVPLLERRRGPLVKQISLNIGSENPVNDFINMTFLPEKTIMSQSTVPVLNKQLRELDIEDAVATRQKYASEPHVLGQSKKHTGALSIQHSFCSNLVTVNSTHASRDFIPTIPCNAEDQDKNVLLQGIENKNCYKPKYQLKINKAQESNLCTSKGVRRTEKIHEPWVPVSSIADVLTNICTAQQKQSSFNENDGKIQNMNSIAVPVHNYTNASYYGYSTFLPEILVTHDQGSKSASEANKLPVPNLKECIIMPKSQEEPSRLLPNIQKSCTYGSIFRETTSKSVPITSLLTQQETSASSKRMLSPANSLDIAMEKHQKRVKDESGSAFITSNPQIPLAVKTNEAVKQRKPMLVRQLCTTDPGECLDLEPTTVPERNKNYSNSLDTQLSDRNHPIKTVNISEHTHEVVEHVKTHSMESSSSAITLPEYSIVNTHASGLKSVYASQGKKSPVATKTVNIQGQVKLDVAISMVNVGDIHRLSFPSLKTSTSFTWCYLLKRKPIHLPQNDQKTSAYASWNINFNNPSLMGLPTKVALSLLNSKQKSEKFVFTLVKTSHPKQDIVVYSSKWENSAKKASESLIDPKNSDSSTDQDKELSLNKNEPRRVKIFDGGYKSNEDYVYVRGRGRGKYICEECGIRCKKPSMLKKHIRTHTDVRPYHCSYCNFSFKTKGNLTKHMKSKAHSKKCFDIGVAVGTVDDQDTDDSGERQKYTEEKAGFDVDDSDGGEDDDNEDEDEDSQAESILSATPSVTASPQHYPFRSSHQEISSADEDLRSLHSFSQSNSMDALPKALITRMTAMTTATICRPEIHEERNKADLQQENSNLPNKPSSPKVLSHQMSVDYADTEGGNIGTTKSVHICTEPPSVNIPSSPVDQSTQTMDSCTDTASSNVYQQQPAESTQQPTPVAPTHTHLFSHLPLHSQQPVRSPYSMIPVGGIQLVPAGLAAYSTFVPLQAAPVQLTIPAMGVIHRTATSHGDKTTEVPSTPNPIGVAEVNGVVPCIPIGQVNVSGLSAPSIQPIQQLNLETLSILGLSNTNVAPQIHPPGLTLNAVGLQVLTAGPAPQSNPNPQTHIPGLQILNIALPTLIPSISPLTVEGPGVHETSSSCCASAGKGPASFSVADAKNKKLVESPLRSPRNQDNHKIPNDSPTLEGKSVSPLTADKECHSKQCLNIYSQVKTSPLAEHYTKVSSETTSKLPVGLSLLRTRRTEAIPRQTTVQFSNSSSDDDEDRLVIAT